jgi:hypothetical protein
VRLATSAMRSLSRPMRAERWQRIMVLCIGGVLRRIANSFVPHCPVRSPILCR